MNLQKKSEIKDSCIMSRPEFTDESEFLAGYFHNVIKIENNNDFLDIYRHIQFFNLPIPDDMLKYASIPNYSIRNIIENMRLTGEDIYFTKLSSILMDPNNIYSTDSILLPKDDDGDIYQQLANINRADLTQQYFDNGEVPDDIYTHISSGNATLEICNILMELGYLPSDEIIYWYMIKGMGGIAKKCFNRVTDVDFVTDCNPVDLTSLKIIQETKWPLLNNENNEDWINKIPLEDATTMLYAMIESQVVVDVAMFISLYRLISNEITQHEKLMLLTNILLKKEKFLISIFLKELVKEGFELNILENTIFSSAKSTIGYQIYKLEIEKSTNHDIIIDYCSDITEGFKFQYYKEDESAFISRVNEKYAETDSSEYLNSNCSSETCSVAEGDDGEFNDEFDKFDDINSFYDSSRVKEEEKREEEDEDDINEFETTENILSNINE